MLPIQGLKCIYDTGARGWAIELALKAEGEDAVRRFDVDGPEDAEMLIEAFDESTSSTFDPATGEIVFAYEYADLGDDEDEDDEDESEDENAEDENDEEEDLSEDETSEDETKKKVSA
jgi:Ran GTPase-activating protein (RanGAP) involved in mRNA processing and transport